jgi:hypothetical protein
VGLLRDYFGHKAKFEPSQSNGLVADRVDLAVRFFEHVICALDLLEEARHRQEADSAADEADADKKN